VVLVTVCGAAYVSGGRQDAAQGQRAFTIVARKYAFAPVRLEVAQDDLVKVTLTSEDRATSFAVDAYRIAKRASGGETITFEFRADQPGTFTFYCNLTTDAGCKNMRGTLVVNKR
jgi:cytochrome c oxidase subunit II